MLLTLIAVAVLVIHPFLLTADSSQAFSWYSDDIAGEIDRARLNNLPLSEVICKFYINLN